MSIYGKKGIKRTHPSFFFCSKRRKWVVKMRFQFLFKICSRRKVCGRESKLSLGPFVITIIYMSKLQSLDGTNPKGL